MIRKFRDLDPQIHVALFICVFVLAAGLLFLLSEVRKIRLASSDQSSTIILEKEECGDNCKGDIRQFIQDIVATIAAVPKTMVAEVPSKQVSENKEARAYLSLGGTFSTTNTDWTDVKSTDVWINLEEEYGKDAYVDWEAFVRIDSRDSKVYVRLYDVTNKIAVIGSELESSSTSTSRVSSGRLYLWRGHNLYRVQIKSLNGLNATFESGRIKIVY